MAVALDAVMTGGTDGDTLAVGATTSFSSASAMTVGASASLLVVVLNWRATAPNNTPGTRVVTWNGVAMTEAIFNTDANTGAVADHCGIYVLVSPATGTKTLAGSWTGSFDCYISAISFTGTDLTTGINAADSVTADAATINVTGSTDGATVATFVTDGATPTSNQTLFWGYQALSPGGGGSYQLGVGGTITHTFTGAGGTWAVTAAIHIIAAAGAASLVNPLIGKLGFPLIGKL